MKHNSLFLFLIVSLLSGLLNACTNNVESCCLRMVDTQPGCSNPAAISVKDLQLKNDTIFRLQQIDENQKDVNLVICSQADYEHYVMVNKGALPTIDFNQTILLAGMHLAPRSDFVQKQTITLCESTLNYQVTLAKGVSTAFTRVYYFALVPRSAAHTSVVFDVK